MPTHSYRKTVSHLAFCILIFALVTQVSSVALLLLLQAWLPDAPALAFVLASLVSYYVLGLGALVLSHRLLLRTAVPAPAKGVLSARVFLRCLLLCFGLSYLFNLLTQGLMVLLQLLTGRTAVNSIETILGASQSLLLPLYMTVIAPLCEELVFRKVLYRYMGGLGMKPYVVFSALFFGLFHMNLFQIPYAFVLGAVFAVIYAATGRIGYTIALHCCINAVGTFAAPLATKSTVAAMLLGLFVLGSMLGAVVLLARHKAAVLPPLPQTQPQPPAHWLRDGLCSPGVLVLLAGVLLVTGYSNFFASGGVS